MVAPEGTGDEKFFRFISDPGHKENLSGRVRAACLTCRRKKIKCSGEVPCRTCQEKGVFCGGLPERKRPRKNPEQLRLRDDLVRTGDVSFSSSSKPRQMSTTATIPLNVPRPSHTQRPIAMLTAMNAIGSDDSGYASGKHSPPNKSIPRAPQLDTDFLVYSALEPCATLNEMSPTTPGPSDWSFIKGQNGSNYCATDTADSEISHSTQMISGTASTTSLEWPDPGVRNNWWPAVKTGSSTASNLISAARMLEEQAQSLRRLASRQEPEGIDDGRRQTITLPLRPEESVTSSMQMPYQQSAFDDLALLLTDRNSLSGVTPMESEFASWWDINPELSHVTGNQQTANTLQQLRPPANPLMMNPTDGNWPAVASENARAQPSALPRHTEQDQVEYHSDAPHPHQHNRGPNLLSGAFGQLESWPG